MKNLYIGIIVFQLILNVSPEIFHNQFAIHVQPHLESHEVDQLAKVSLNKCRFSRLFFEILADFDVKSE